MLKLNLGCGPHLMEGWVNVDLEHQAKAGCVFVQHDLSKGLPLSFHPDSVDFIFSEHFIEHITREQAVKLLSDCHRVLKPKGVMRVSTPDLWYLCKSYIENNLKAYGEGWGFQTTCQMVNQGMREWGHTFLYDGYELTKVFKEAGFNFDSFERLKPGVSKHEQLSVLEVRPYHHDLILEFYKN